MIFSEKRSFERLRLHRALSVLALFFKVVTIGL
jgi:hypothetical protein